MRDIRKDLRDRLEAINSQRERLEKRLTQLDEKRAMLKTLLQEEEAEWSVKQPTLLELGGNLPQKMRGQIEAFLLTTLSDDNPHNINDLIVLAKNRGVPIKDKRSINAPLQGMRRKNLVRTDGKGVWRKK